MISITTNVYLWNLLVRNETFKDKCSNSFFLKALKFLTIYFILKVKIPYFYRYIYMNSLMWIVGQKKVGFQFIIIVYIKYGLKGKTLAIQCPNDLRTNGIWFSILLFDRVIRKVTLSSPCSLGPLSPLIRSFSGIRKVKTF
jgi:hypothetical protein